jgi:DNA-binding NarL/FixJ family response regulator
MESFKQNLFLLEENLLSTKRMVAFLEKKFPDSLIISTFANGVDLLNAINLETKIVVLDYDLKGKRTDILLKQIKKINPNTEIIVLSKDDDIEIAINAYRHGARIFIPKNKNRFIRIKSIIVNILFFPVTIIKHYFGLKQFLAIFIIEILYIGLFVFVGYKILNG